MRDAELEKRGAVLLDVGRYDIELLGGTGLTAE
jgi:hypothetical protein